MYCITIVLLSFISFIYVYLKKKYSYWSERGVKGPAPTALIGNFGKVMMVKQSFDDLMREVYSQFPDEKVVGIYRGLQPVLVVRDPELIKHMLLKDFYAFQDRGLATNFPRFKRSLFVASGNTWKILRQKLTPMFTSGKLKNMMPLVQKCVDEYIYYVGTLVSNDVDHEVRHLKSKYTLQVIGSCAFGLHLGAISDKENEFSIVAKSVLSPTTLTRFLMAADMVIPGIKALALKLSHSVDYLQNFFVALVAEIIKERTKEPMKRKDFMDLLIELKDQGPKNDGNDEEQIEIDDVLIAAQALVFYTAGFETSAAAMAYLTHELAYNQEYQEKVYKQICELYEKYNNQLPYEAIAKMTFLQMALDATLRKYPVAGTIMRRATADYTFPGTSVTVEKGTHLFVSVHGLHHDPKYYSDPELFQPEQFSPENKKNLRHCVYLPFSAGSRNCIGYRFAKMQSVLGMAAFLKNFKVEPSKKTKHKLNFDPKGLTLTVLNGIWVKITKR